MSKQVNMTGWSDVTAAVYTELLSSPNDFEAVYTAAKSTNPKKNNYWKAARQARDTTQAVITKNLPTNSFAGRVIASALGQVDWQSLTRRLVNQGQIDSQVYRDIRGLMERTNNHAESPQAE